LSTLAGGRSLEIAKLISTMKIKLTYMAAARTFIASPTSSNVSPERARPGRSAIKRAAAVPGSVCGIDPSGSAAINEANL
jgi:hypothetical protein